MRQLWIARHGRREDDEIPDWESTAQFPFDPDLSPSGREQAVRTGRLLAAKPIDRLLSSPYLRTRHTGHHFAAALGLTVGLEPGLGEMLNAEWFPSRPQLNGTEDAVSPALRLDVAYRSGPAPRFPETRAEHQERCEQVIAHILATCPGNILVVTHAASVYGITLALTGREEPGEVAPCSLTLLTGPPWRIETFADTAHLRDDPVTGGR